MGNLGNDNVTREQLTDLGLPATLRLVCFGRGLVRHVREPGSRREIWCNIAPGDSDSVRPAEETDNEKPICGGCVRSMAGVAAQLAEGSKTP